MQHRYWAVPMLESERGWGSKIDDIIYFKSDETATKYRTDYNNKYNNKSQVPDWYIAALDVTTVEDFVTVTKLNQYFKTHDVDKVSRDELKAIKIAGE